MRFDLNDGSRNDSRGSGARRARRSLLLLVPGQAATALALAGAAAAFQAPADQGDDVPTGPITGALQSVDEAVRVYNDHLTILASPWMEGRLPGTRGMELAKEYIEHYFREYGLQPAVPGEGQMGFRQEFELGSKTIVDRVDLEATVGGKARSFQHGAEAEYTLTGLGSGDSFSGDLAFVGFGIAEGPDDFTSYAADADLSGKIAVMLRYEPLDDRGWSRWNDGEGWTRNAQFIGKLRAAKERGAAGVIIVNTPGAADPRSDTLLRARDTGGSLVDVPVLHMSTTAGRALAAMATGGAHTLDDLTALAGDGPVEAAFQGKIQMSADVRREIATAENLIGMLPGKGDLKDEVIVIGAHLDHLGMGDFGSRDRYAGRLLHPGADDNASGSAGILHIASRMGPEYANAPDDANMRTILFIAFSAEESGLDGSRYYVNNPLVPIEDHVLMMNFDMIGRMKDSRLSLSGVDTAEGLKDLVKPHAESNPLTVVQGDGPSGGSDHRPFFASEVPVLFAIIADFHPDYHTSRDKSFLINRVEAVHAADLFCDIALDYAKRAERLPFKSQQRRRREAREREQEQEEARAPSAPAKVRLGVRPEYEEEPNGVLVNSAGEDSPAGRAGIKAGDRLVSFDGKDMPGPRELAEFLRASEPGQTVKIGLVRDGNDMTVEVTLVARDGQ